MRNLFVMAGTMLLCCATTFAGTTTTPNPKELFKKPPGIVIPQDNSSESVELRKVIDADASDRKPGSVGKPGATTRPPQNRYYVDNPDATDRLKVHLIYAVPAGGIDYGRDLSTQFPYSVSAANRWLASQTKKKFLLDTYEDHLDITFALLPNTEDYYQFLGGGKHFAIINDLRSMNQAAQPNKVYVVYYEGSHSYACADAEWRGVTTVVYLSACGVDSGTSFASSPTADPDYQEFVFLHELVHNAVGISFEAPNQTLGGHVSDSPADLMYAGDQIWQPLIVDYNKDDYYSRKSLLPGLMNLNDSPMLTR